MPQTRLDLSQLARPDAGAAVDGPFEKGDRRVERHLEPDREFRRPDGTVLRLHGRALMLIRNVGLHMMTDIVQLDGPAMVPEGILDAAITALAGLNDLRVRRRSAEQPDRLPLCGEAEAARSRRDGFCRRDPGAGGAPRGTARRSLKIGIMDVGAALEPSTSRHCVHAAADRVVFINNRLPRPDRRRDPHQHGKPGRCSPRAT